MRFIITTFGCKSNQYETQGLRESLLAAGWRETGKADDADLGIVNTCAVTQRAEASCRQAVRAWLRIRPGLKIAWIGCAVDLDAVWPADLPRPWLVLANNRKAELAARLVDFPGEVAAAPPPPDFPFALTDFKGHRRGFVKIQDGCDNFCAYCAVPLARGAPRSRPADEVVNEARSLLDGGRRELALTGINIGAWRGGDGDDLADLLRRLAKLDGLGRLRLGSVEPPTFTDRLVDAMAGLANLCPHVHLPLQSGDDATLAAMGRRYDTAFFADRAEALRRRLDRPAITTDVIVGFPGESDAAFRRTREFCAAMDFSRTHVFPYSPRPGTPAAARDDAVPADLVRTRRDLLLADARERAERYAAGFAGRTVTVLAEKTLPDGLWVGYTEHYVRARFTGPAGLAGRLARVRAETAEDGALFGRFAKADSLL